MMADTTAFCSELARCNQRGGRMLSVFDLIEADTLPLDLASFLMARLLRGASFLVGARPGGAGKTTVMCGLLSLAPKGYALIPATRATLDHAIHQKRDTTCLICHEIGAGPYFAYLWGKDLRDYCALSGKGYMLATNLHADDLDEAEYQICRENGVPLPHFQAFQLAIFLRLERSMSGIKRRVDTVYLSEDAAPHHLVYDSRHGIAAQYVDPACYRFLETGLARGLRTLEETRDAVVQFTRRDQADAAE